MKQLVGSFKDGLIDGYGILYYNNTSVKYNGTYEKDQKNGKGILNYLNSSQYVGDFKNGKYLK